MVIITLRKSQMYYRNRDYNIKSGKRYGTLRYIFGGVFGTSSPPRVHPLSTPVVRSGRVGHGRTIYGPLLVSSTIQERVFHRFNRGGEGLFLFLETLDFFI